jgi:DNA-binding MarR family transcriptional regulator
MTANNATLITELISATNRVTRMAGRLATEPRNSTNYRTLGLLRQFGPSRIGEIAAHERISQPGATKIVASLEAEGLVARENDPADGRASVITITPLGLAALESWMNELADNLLPRVGPLSDDDRAAIARTIALLEFSLKPQRNTSK